MDIGQANEEFGIAGVLSICAGEGGFPIICIDNEHARAEISSYGGQVLSFHPQRAAQDLLFVSEYAYFQPGKAIKGGIPVCWPWFGPDPEAKGRPDHGFVRARQWRLLGTEAMVDGSTRVRLGCRDDEASRALWPHAFALEVEVTVADTLGVALTTRNTGEAPITVTQALHSYFKVGDVRRVQVLGLAGYEYIDKVARSEPGAADPGQVDVHITQSGPINFDGPVNRIYLDTGERLVIDDPALSRQIRIDREGSGSAVVWNPWIEQSKQMGDFGDDEYLQMVCVETTNAAADAVTIPAGGSHRLASRYGLVHD
ncbi:D-hexose-6-phosphate mutarotase [Thiohalocapsa halophila]|uniref:Putative glucose-6-phosphate 1-epimerase n=1 Tax=Thiohalocapsa halophila TaxID=69359 RepID=A0ABS1CD81_9GAMM|nr:D-hexose-6-phosphate mutarotase [Thiohalocapsa halophila]MBK1629439.1 D-hexose-6-phosphate mutarotase [Thiohalocapsa halophila]